jgi:hypothetical protein
VAKAVNEMGDGPDGTMKGMKIEYPKHKYFQNGLFLNKAY